MPDYGETAKAVDEKVRQREADYQARRKAAGQEGTDWAAGLGEFTGNVALTAPLMLTGTGTGEVARSVAAEPPKRKAPQDKAASRVLNDLGVGSPEGIAATLGLGP
jgi:hypothetical protein